MHLWYNTSKPCFIIPSMLIGMSISLIFYIYETHPCINIVLLLAMKVVLLKTFSLDANNLYILKCRNLPHKRHLICCAEELWVVYIKVKYRSALDLTEHIPYLSHRYATGSVLWASGRGWVCFNGIYIGSDNGLSPVWHQVTIWINVVNRALPNKQWRSN